MIFSAKHALYSCQIYVEIVLMGSWISVSGANGKKPGPRINEISRMDCTCNDEFECLQ